MKKVKKGFTLVELIVVITILAILGTIGFISLQGYSADARNTKRTSDINNLATAISSKLSSGVGILSFVSSDPLAKVNSIQIGGTGALSGSTSNYEAGQVNYTILGVRSDLFNDSVFNVAYAIGATSKVGGRYQLATKLERGSGIYIAKVIGDYSPRTDLTKTVTTTYAYNGTANSITLTGSSDIGKFLVGDTLSGSSLQGGISVITRISSDGKTMYLDKSPTGTGIINLGSAETAGLIDAGGSATGVVVTDGTAAFPYY